ncbi:MAG: DUF3332 domain-containing protein [Flavobacteriaceae bacterium]|jgi:hypothetical protein|uniref:DUF3332 domain-containing protein n=1 Tax=Flagellimonas TaxID=444459 RepID=UPI000E247335|nr:DUF3332 domain-containing protein [Allomuricauda sp.]MCR9263873.1 DUF3332 domain-containing protein [Flavobacteriaceae bacterium]
MKKVISCLLLSSTILFSSCLGSFKAFNNLKDWNQGATDSKFVDNLIFWGLWIVPVYELFLLGDAIIFNVIEFWSGSNPIAMKEGESETQMVEHDGNTFKMVATKNRVQVSVVAGPKQGKKIDLVYKPDEKSWNAVRPNGEIIKLSSFEEGFYIVYMPNGEQVKIDPMSTRQEGLAILQESKTCYYSESLLAD